MDEASQAVAAERRRIAAWLHDGPIQQLMAAQLFLESAAFEPDEADRDRRLRQGSEALGEAIVSCRQLMRELAGDDEDP